MTRIEGFNDPLAQKRMEHLPIGSPKESWKGAGLFVKPVFLRLCPPTIDNPICRRMPTKKQCARCGRGTRLQFAYGEFLKLRLCRRNLAEQEKAALFMMLTEAEVGGLTD